MDNISEKPIRIYQCENTVNGILSAIYDAGLSGYGHRFIRIQPQKSGEADNFELFSEYVMSDTDEKKAESVITAVRSKISQQAYWYMMYVLASCYSDRADAVYQFITYGFTMGSRVCSALQIPCVKRVFEIQREVGNEAHFFREILRFQKVHKEPSMLFAVIEPKHRIVPMVTEHFADRFLEEWFVIYDKTHREASFHYADGKWEIRILTEQEAVELEKCTEQEEEYADLWKTFFENIAIVERISRKRQMNMLPLHYRKHMTEFENEKIYK
ncbi:MAG: TIGR03915 family putative DNA repair protein [Butyribacter sp.]|nr:TIGR03915 family putative DNA repair protein [bacterium]MDY3853963.1 TIGR03915 family putative DNA repair protein [Butyribacter sp.]